VLRLVAEIGVGVAIAEVRAPEEDGEGDGVSGIPFARLTLELPSTVTITSNASPAQVDFARRREGACRAHLPASYLGDGWRLFTIGDFRAGLGCGRDWQLAESVIYQRGELAGGPLVAAHFVTLNADNLRFDRFVPR
jgi:hypothetical protein